MKDARIDEYINNAQPFAQPILAHLRELIHKALPDVQETIKWGSPSFDYKGGICMISGFKEHCTFGFFKESLMPDLQKYLKDHVIDKSSAMGSWGRIQDLSNLPPDEKIISWVKEAALLNEKGLKVKRSAPETRKKNPMPEFVRRKLESNNVMDAYNSRPPYQQNDYVGWISEAKQEETRQKRLEQMIDELKKGNVYMKMKWSGGK